MKFYCKDCDYKTKELDTITKVKNALVKDGGKPIILNCGLLKSIMCNCPKCNSNNTKLSL